MEEVYLFKKRIIAYYLPQFHRIPENDNWWGEGYTEWTALKRWKPFFKGHNLRFPGDLGFYDLSTIDIMKEQYQLAESHGIEGFCLWTYWFGAGETLLERPLENLLKEKHNIKYCIAWANHSWLDKKKWLMLKEQKYLGAKDYALFFEMLLPHFNSGNYIFKDNKPVVAIYLPKEIPDFAVLKRVWTELSLQHGFAGIYFISDLDLGNHEYSNLFDAFTNSLSMFKNRNFFQKIKERLVRQYSWDFLGPIVYSYPKMMKDVYQNWVGFDNFIPTIFTGWDTTPRHGKRGVVLKDFTLESFGDHVRSIFSLNFKSEFIFIKSWNEWAEGNTLEPDSQNGDGLLQIVYESNVRQENGKFKI